MRKCNKYHDPNALAMVDFRYRSYIWFCLLGFIWCSSARKATRCLKIFAHSVVPPPTTVSHGLLSITPSGGLRYWYSYFSADFLPT